MVTELCAGEVKGTTKSKQHYILFQVFDDNGEPSLRTLYFKDTEHLIQGYDDIMQRIKWVQRLHKQKEEMQNA